MRISDWSSDVCSSDLQWADLAEGRLRLDRLCRNSGVETFFPCRLRRHSSRAKKASPLLSGPCGVRRQSPPACRSPSRPQWCGLGTEFKENYHGEDRKSTRLNSSN